MKRKKHLDAVYILQIREQIAKIYAGEKANKRTFPTIC
jgi:hypothetical protein